MGSPKNELCKAVATTLLVLRQARLPIRPGEVIAETLNSAFETFLNQDADEYGLVSEQVKHSLKEYAENRRSVGGFLTAMLENDLASAVARADGQNFPAIPQIMKWIYNKLPSACWGSPEKVANWLAHEFQIDEQGETKEIKAGLSNVVPATRVAHCPFCAKGVRFFFGGEDGFGLRPHECAHVVAYGQNDEGDHVVTFHRSAEEKAGKSGPSVYSTPFGEPGERDGIE